MIIIINNQINRWTFSESALTGCFEADADYGMMFWTAGQRKRLTGFFGPPFLWRVTSDGGDTEYSMTYTNWQTDQPDFLDRNEFCMEISAGHSYRWNDHPCSSEMCFVCELDMWVHKQRLHTLLRECIQSVPITVVSTYCYYQPWHWCNR